MSGGANSIRVQNMALVGWLSTFFQRRNEPQFSMAKSISIARMLAGLRGCWPMSSADNTGAAYDFSGQGRTLTYNGNPMYGFDQLVPYIVFDGTGDYLSRADEAGLDITGTETTVVAAERGLSLGGWFYPTRVGGSYGFVSKWNTTGDQRSYLLGVDASNHPYFSISSLGTAATVATVTSTATVALDTWYYIAARFVPSTGLYIYVNSTATTQASALTAVFASTAIFNIGGINAGSLMFGRVSMCYLCANRLSAPLVETLYEQSRSAYRR